MSIAGRDVSRGSYNPVTTAREIALGGKSSADLNEMVSFHESYHAFLNASTTFGVAMVYCGALIEVSERPFFGIVSDMVDRSIVTHETFATVRGLLTASYGDVSSPLLNSFPDYLVHLDRFVEIFEPRHGIGLATMALTNAARAAMQVPLYSWLRETPCEQWHQLPLETCNDPDLRFKALLKPEIVRAAKTAMLEALGNTSSILKDLARKNSSTSDQWRAISQATLKEFVPPDIAAFDVFAKALEQEGFGRAGYDDQRHQLSALTSKVEVALGPGSNQKFMSPQEEEDLAAVIGDFRREVLSFRDHGLPLVVTDLEEQNSNVIQAFVHSGNAGQHLQFVSMPLNKAEHVFRIVQNCAALKRLNSEHLSGFRRLARTPDGGYRVEFLVVEEDKARSLTKDMQDVTLYKTLSLVTTRDKAWSSTWTSDVGFLTGNHGVVIDDDPIALMERLAERGGDVSVVGYRMNLPVQNHDSIVLDLIAYRSETEPDRLYFTPCTSSLRTAVLKLALDKGKPFTIEKNLPSKWQKFLADTLFNLLQEEGRFGAAFWVSGQ